MPLSVESTVDRKFQFSQGIRSFSENNIIKESDRSPMKIVPEDDVRTYIDSHIF